jgi:hypothetical protein
MERAGRPGRVVTVGEAMVRLTPPGNERLERTGSLNLTVGGAELNTAVGLVCLPSISESAGCGQAVHRVVGVSSQPARRWNANRRPKTGFNSGCCSPKCRSGEQPSALKLALARELLPVAALTFDWTWLRSYQASRESRKIPRLSAQTCSPLVTVPLPTPQLCPAETLVPLENRSSPTVAAADSWAPGRRCP